MSSISLCNEEQDIIVPEYDGTWGDGYEEREAMFAVRDGNNIELERLYPLYSEHKDDLFAIACDFGNLDAAQFLFEQGADVNGGEDSEPTDRPFMFALRSRNLAMIRWMLTLPDLDANVEMDCGYNGLAFAIDNNFPLDIIESMHSCWAEISENFGEFYPLSMAAHKNNIPAVALLLAHGADPHYVDGDNHRVSYYASGPLKELLEQWTPLATQMLNHVISVRGHLVYNPSLLPETLRQAQIRSTAARTT